MEEIASIIMHANISLEDRKDLIACNIQTLKRFFEGDQLSEMLNLLTKEAENEKIEDIIKTYGRGFEEVYYDGKYEGRLDGKCEVAENLLKKGLDEATVAEYTGLSIKKIIEIKRKH